MGFSSGGVPTGLLSGVPWIDVKDPVYGATGDGTTDDSTAIQAAIAVAQAQSPPGKILFPQGRYRLTTGITLTAQSTTVGASTIYVLPDVIGDDAILLPDSGVDALTITSTASPSYGGNISGLVIDGQDFATIGGAGTSTRGLVLKNVTFTESDNLVIRNCTTGVRFLNTNSLWTEHNRVSGYIRDCVTGITFDVSGGTASFAGNRLSVDLARCNTSINVSSTASVYRNRWDIQAWVYASQIGLDLSGILAGLQLIGTFESGDATAKAIVVEAAAQNPDKVAASLWFTGTFANQVQNLHTTLDLTWREGPTGLYSLNAGSVRSNLWFKLAQSGGPTAFGIDGNNDTNITGLIRAVTSSKATLQLNADTGGLQLKTQAAANKGLAVKAASSQSANLQEWQNSSGTPLSSIGPAGALTVGGGVGPDGGGIKHSRITTGSVSAASTALVTVTWTTAFADANYTVQASVVDSTTSSLSLTVVHVESVTASAVTVRVLNNSAGSLTGTLHVVAFHD